MIGNGNTGYSLQAAIYSAMKYNAEYIEKIIVVDNSSTDYTGEFLAKNRYADITEVIKYDLPSRRDPTAKIPCAVYLTIGLDACKTKYCLLTHSDIIHRSGICSHFFNVVLKEMPDCFMYGAGGGGIAGSPWSRIHEYCMIIDVDKYRKIGIPFAGIAKGGKCYDVGCYLYEQTCTKEQIKTIDEHPDDTVFYKHIVMGSHERKAVAEAVAKEWLDANP
jgi:glycosyltransferase involved in cell wall biosynthesis